MIKGVIFDLDGVIVHTDELHYWAWKRIAEQLGAEFDRETNNRLRGVSRMESLDIVLERSRPLSSAEKQSLASEKNGIYRGLLNSLSENDVETAVPETLRALRGGGIKLAIGSSSKNAPLILERTKLACYFDAVSDGNNISRSKPDPEVFLLAAEYLGLAPHECAVVEDARAGIDAANAGGFISAGIGDASRYGGADYKLNSITDIIEIVRAANEKTEREPFTR